MPELQTGTSTKWYNEHLELMRRCSFLYKWPPSEALAIDLRDLRGWLLSAYAIITPRERKER